MKNVLSSQIRGLNPRAPSPKRYKPQQRAGILANFLISIISADYYRKPTRNGWGFNATRRMSSCCFFIFVQPTHSGWVFNVTRRLLTSLLHPPTRFQHEEEVPSLRCVVSSSNPSLPDGFQRVVSFQPIQKGWVFNAMRRLVMF